MVEEGAGLRRLEPLPFSSPVPLRHLKLVAHDLCSLAWNTTRAGAMTESTLVLDDGSELRLDSAGSPARDTLTDHEVSLANAHLIQGNLAAEIAERNAVA